MKKIIEQYFSFIRGLIPDKDQQSRIGLDVRPDACYLVELFDKGNKQYELVNWIVEPVVQANVKEALQKIFERFETPPIVSTAVSGKGTLIRYIDMPQMSASDVQNSLELEADKYFPFDPETVYIDSHVLNDKSKEAMPVLVAAVKRDMVNERIAMLQDLDVTPATISLNSVAGANAFEAFAPCEPDDLSELTCAIVDVTQTVTNLMIVHEGVPRFTRDIYIGAQEFINRIANSLDVSQQEARELAERPGARRKEVEEATESIIANLTAEIKISLEYFMTEKNIQVKKLYLTGDGATIAGIDEAFIGQLGVQFELWSALNKIKISDSIPSEDIMPYALKLNTAIGLALNHD